MDRRKSEGIWYENEIAKRLREAGYINVKTTAASGDKGADLFWAHPNGKKFVGQCKYYSYDNKVSSEVVSAVYTAKELYKCDEAVIFTSSVLTSQAKQMAMQLNVFFEERYNPVVDANRIQRVTVNRGIAPSEKLLYERFAELVEFLDYKILKRGGGKILSMDNEGDVVLWQYINKPVVDISDVLALYKMKDFYGGEYGCDSVFIVTSGVLTKEAKERILNVGGYAFENKSLDDTYMAALRAERAKKIKEQDVRHSGNGSQKAMFEKVCPNCGVFKSDVERVRFCPKCGSRVLTTQEVESRRRKERLQANIDNATTKELVDGYVALLIEMGYKIIHKENNIIFVLADEDVLMCKYVDGDISPQSIIDVVKDKKRYEERGLHSTGISLVASGDIVGVSEEEIKKLHEQQIDIESNKKFTKEAIQLLKENNML